MNYAVVKDSEGRSWIRAECERCKKESHWKIEEAGTLQECAQCGWPFVIPDLKVKQARPKEVTREQKKKSLPGKPTTKNIRVSCSYCGKESHWKPGEAGQYEKCISCGWPLKIPSEDVPKKQISKLHPLDSKSTQDFQTYFDIRGRGWIKLACPRCKEKIECKAGQAGELDSCPICSQTFVVPGLEFRRSLEAKKSREEAKRKESIRAKQEEKEKAIALKAQRKGQAKLNKINSGEAANNYFKIVLGIFCFATLILVFAAFIPNISEVTSKAPSDSELDHSASPLNRFEEVVRNFHESKTWEGKANYLVNPNETISFLKLTMADNEPWGFERISLLAEDLTTQNSTEATIRIQGAASRPLNVICLDTSQDSPKIDFASTIRSGTKSDIRMLLLAPERFYREPILLENLTFIDVDRFGDSLRVRMTSGNEQLQVVMARELWTDFFLKLPPGSKWNVVGVVPDAGVNKDLLVGYDFEPSVEEVVETAKTICYGRYGSNEKTLLKQELGWLGKVSSSRDDQNILENLKVFNDCVFALECLPQMVLITANFSIQYDAMVLQRPVDLANNKLIDNQRLLDDITGKSRRQYPTKKSVSDPTPLKEIAEKSALDLVLLATRNEVPEDFEISELTRALWREKSKKLSRLFESLGVEIISGDNYLFIDDEDARNLLTEKLRSCLANVNLSHQNRWSYRGGSSQ